MNLPVTIGVPLGESVAVSDAAQLGLVDSNNAAVPAQIRPMVRWRGAVTDTTKLLKWVLVDFKPTAAGTYYLTRAAQAVPAGMAITRTETTSAIKIKNAQLEIEFARTGTALINSLKLAGTEMFKAPATIAAEVPRAGMITVTDVGPSVVTVTDTSSLRVGDDVRFFFHDTLKWGAPAGTDRLVTNSADYLVGHRYVLEDGTPRREEVVINSIVEAQDMRTVNPLRFSHDPGAKVRDLTVEAEAARIRKISGQLVDFDAPLKYTHAKSEKVWAVATWANPPSLETQTAKLQLSSAKIEEANALRTVVLQEGGLFVGTTRIVPMLSFKLRYYVYADQPFVRVRVQTTNEGTYGFGAYNLNKGTYPQHALLRSLSAFIPTVGTASGAVEVLTSATAHQYFDAGQTGATLQAGSGTTQLELSVPEFAENFPKCLKGNPDGLRFDLLPNLGSEYIFDGARAKTTDFYLGREVVRGRVLTNSQGAKVDAAYLAQTGAVRPAMLERRTWSQAFAQDTEMAEAATRYERLMASAYDLASCNGPKPQSMFEYRRGVDFGEHLGWRNFGDLGWGDGYTNLHYDLPFILLREYLRTGDPRAFQLGSELTRYRSDWGQYHGTDFWDEQQSWNFKGMAFYEKGDHGSFLEPKPSHTWVEGLWLYWAMTGDESVRESAVAGSDAFKRMFFSYDASLNWNEPRWVGWPVLGLMVAWRYTGDLSYLTRARDNTYLLVQTEENAGRKGYYIATETDWAVKAVQPWSWMGYAQQGVIEYWRETQDKRVADYLVRLADWYIGKGIANPPLAGGIVQNDGSYLPLATSYYWEPTGGKVYEDRSVLSGGMGLHVMIAAARITNRPDLWAKSRQLFRDTAFYRDLVYGGMSSSTRSSISFLSAFYTGSSTKAYGQTALNINDYLPELLGTVVLPRSTIVVPAGGSSPTPTPTATPSSGGNTSTNPSVVPETSGMINVAFKKRATASSVRVVTGVTGDPSSANDGLLRTNNLTSLWHSALNTGKAEWLQIDLLKSERLTALEVIFRPDIDQPVARRNFAVLASNDPTFATASKLAEQGDTAVPFSKRWKVGVADASQYRYVRIQKTKTDDKDAQGQQYFHVTEFKVYAVPTPPAPVALPDLSKLANVALNQPATASSTRSFPDFAGMPATATDGKLSLNGQVYGWHSEINRGQLEWWQTDLGKAMRMRAVEIVFRADVDQANCRRNFVVLGSATPDFENPVVLAMPTGEAAPFGQTWRVGIGDAMPYRYIRVMKTLWDANEAPEQRFFNLVEVRLFAEAAPKQVSLDELAAVKLTVGQTLTFSVKKTDEQNRPLTISVGVLPESATFDPAQALFTFTPNSRQAGKLFPLQFFGAVNGTITKTARMDTTVTLEGAPKVVLTAPAASTALIAGQPVVISWATEPGARVVRYQVSLSANQGVSYNLMLGEVAGNVGQFRWQIPANYPTNQPLRFMVTATDDQNRIGLDCSTQNLIVQTPR